MFLSTRRTHKLKRAETSGSLFRTMVKEQAGLTVVELLIAATILVFVLAGAYTFFSFGWSSFDRGTDRAVVQNNLRMAAQKITEEVRFAEGISIIDTSDVPDPVDDDYIYIFVNNDSRIERKNKNESEIIPHELDSNVFLELGFEKSSDNEDNDNVLKVVITETNSNMTLETEILILNIPRDGGSIENSSGNAIRIDSNGSGGNPGTIPVISNMIIDPDQHFAGSAQIVNVTINTQNVNDGTEITLDFLDTDATTVLYSLNAIINNDTALTVLNLPDSLPAGSYILRASEVDIPNDYNANYTINNVINTLAFSNTDNPTNATVDNSYAGHTFSATGGVTPYSYSITAGSLPTGMSMNAGMLEGTPTVDGTYTFTVTVNDSSNPMESASHEFTLVVDPVDVNTFADFLVSNNVFIYSSNLAFSGGNINGSSSKIIISGEQQLNGKTLYPDLYIDGNFVLLNSTIYGNIYVDGNVELRWGAPTFNGDSRVYYSGILTHPSTMSQAVVSKCISIDSPPGIDIPNHPLPPLKEASWFQERGYVSSGALANGIKVFANSYSSTVSPSISNVIIVAANGNINVAVGGGSTLTGILYAPNGSVTFTGAHFKGVVIARDGFSATSGGSQLTYQDISTFISNPADYPF